MADSGLSFADRVILELVEPESTVLDLGCGGGDLMEALIREKRVRAQGIDIDEQAIYRCVERGLSVIHWDLDSGLDNFGDGSFEYVILNQSLQQVRRLERTFFEALRVAKRVILAFPNFAHHRVRAQILLRGRTPTTNALPYPWHASPNLHFFSVLELEEFCQKNRIRIERAVGTAGNRRIRFWRNLRAQVGIYLLSRPPEADRPDRFQAII